MSHSVMNIPNSPTIAPGRDAEAHTRIVTTGIVRSSALALHPGEASAVAGIRLTDLPVEMLTQIAGEVQRADGVFRMQALLHTSRQLRALGNIDSIGRVHALQRHVVVAAMALARRVLDDNEAIERYPSLLGLLPVEERGRLARKVFSTLHGDGRRTLLAQLGGQLQHLSDGQRSRFVTEVLADMSGTSDGPSGDEPGLLNEVGHQLLHLSEVDRGRLVTGAVAIGHAQTRNDAIFDLGLGMDHLSPDLRTRMFESAFTDAEHGGDKRALHGLSVHVGHLSEAQRSRLLVWALAQEKVVDRLIPLTGALRGTLGGAQRDTLFNDMCAIDDDQERLLAFMAMTSGLAHLNEAQRGRFVQAALAFTDGGARSIIVGAMGMELSPLAPAHREQLLAAAVGWVDTQDQTDSTPGGQAVAGLAAGLPHLSRTQRIRLVDAALALPASWGREHALSSVAKGIAHMDEDQRERVATAVLQSNAAGALESLMAGAVTLGEFPRAN